MFSLFDNKERLLESLQTKNEQLEKSNKLMVAEINDFKRIFNESVDMKYEYDEKVKTMAQEHLAKVNELNIKMELERKSVNRKVNLALANIGVDNDFFAEEIIPTMTSDDLKDKFNKMPEGKLKHEFFEKNKNILIK